MSLHHERHRTGDPVLLISGFAESGAVFESVLESYARHFECIVYGQRGTGRSPPLRRPTSIARLARDATQVLAEARVDRAHVYGVSMGGMVAQELAIRYPERVRGLVLGCTTTGAVRGRLRVSPVAPPRAGRWRSSRAPATAAEHRSCSPRASGVPSPSASTRRSPSFTAIARSGRP